MTDAPQKGSQDAPAAEKQTVSLLDQAIAKAYRPKTDNQKTEAKRDVETLIREITKGIKFGSKKVDIALRERIEAIDALLSKQVGAIMHAEQFRTLEGTWRGMHYLVHQSNTSPMLKIRVLNATKQELKADQDDASEFDQAALFKKVYEQAYGVFGGAPYSALIGDYQWGKEPEDVELLQRISNVAAAAHAPFISAASPDLFGWDRFTELDKPRDLSMIFESVEYAAWKSFRQSEDSRYVGLTLPRVLSRLPYGKKTKKVEAFDFEEEIGGSHDNYVWMNAAYTFGCRLTDAFDRHSWCVAVVGVEGGGLVQGLPTHTYKSDQGDMVMKCPTELPITDRREAELYKLGFMPILHCKDTPNAAFFGAQSARMLKKWDTDDANANESLSAELQFLMATSRFAHYLKAIMRDKVGAFMERKDVEDYLNRWIQGYVLLDGSAAQDTKAKFPLKKARVDVKERPGMPGQYQAIAYLRPHFQLKEIDISLRLVANLPPPAAK